MEVPAQVRKWIHFHKVNAGLTAGPGGAVTLGGVAATTAAAGSSGGGAGAGWVGQAFEAAELGRWRQALKMQLQAAADTAPAARNTAQMATASIALALTPEANATASTQALEIVFSSCRNGRTEGEEKVVDLVDTSLYSKEQAVDALYPYHSILPLSEHLSSFLSTLMSKGKGLTHKRSLIAICQTCRSKSCAPKCQFRMQ
eukprot:6174352-Pleurochrysis_carterae.AAC.7